MDRKHGFNLAFCQDRSVDMAQMFQMDIIIKEPKSLMECPTCIKPTQANSVSLRQG